MSESNRGSGRAIVLAACLLGVGLAGAAAQPRRSVRDGALRALMTLQPPKGFVQESRLRPSPQGFFLVHLAGKVRLPSHYHRVFTGDERVGGKRVSTTTARVMVLAFKTPPEAAACFAKLYNAQTPRLAYQRATENSAAMDRRYKSELERVSKRYEGRRPPWWRTGQHLEEVVGDYYGAKVQATGGVVECVRSFSKRKLITQTTCRQEGTRWACTSKATKMGFLKVGEVREQYQLRGAFLVMVGVEYVLNPQTSRKGEHVSVGVAPLRFPQAAWQALLKHMLSQAAVPPRPGSQISVTCEHPLYAAVSQVRPGDRRVNVRLSGTVTDTHTNSPVPSATVTATQLGRPFRTTTDKNGRYQLLVQVHRTPLQKPDRCDFLLKSSLKTLTLQWAIEGSGYAVKTTTRHAVPGSLRELVVRGQALTPGGQTIPYVTAEAAWGPKKVSARADRSGAFTIVAALNPNGVGRMTVSKIQTFHLARRPGGAGLPVMVTCQHRLYPVVTQTVPGDRHIGSIRISGTVVDSRVNLPVQGARVTAKYLGRSSTATSGRTGKYELLVVVSRNRTQKTERRDFRLQSSMTSLTVKWRIEGGEYFTTKTQTYPIPASLRTLVIKGQALTEGGRIVPGAVVNASWGGKALVTQTDRKGMFAMTGTCNRDGIGQMSLSQVQVFRLKRWQEPAGPDITLTCGHKLFRPVAQTRPGAARANVRLSGTVIDSHTGTPVPGATITATQQGRSFRAVSDRTGTYTLVVQLYRTALQKPDKCDFRLQSDMTTLALAWHVEGGDYAGTTTGQYTIPASLRELAIRGQVLTEDGREIPGALVNASWRGEARVTRADQKGLFTMSGVCNPNGIGQMVLAKVQVFRLSRWQERPPDTDDQPGASLEARILARYRTVAKETLPKVPPQMIAKLEKLLGAGSVHARVAADKPLDAMAARRVLQVLYYQIDGRHYLTARKILGMAATEDALSASAEQVKLYLTALGALYRQTYPKAPVGRTLGEVSAGFEQQMRPWLGAADGSALPAVVRAEAAIGKYLSRELRLKDVAASVDGSTAVVAFRVETGEAGRLRGQLLSTALAAATFAPWAKDVTVVPHIHGVPVGALTIPPSAMALLTRRLMTGEKFLASWKSTVFSDLFAFWRPPGPAGAGKPGTGDDAYPPPPPPPDRPEDLPSLPPPPPPEPPKPPVKARDYAAETADPTAPDAEFVTSLFRCILHREPEADELRSAVAKLTSGRPRSEIITQLFISPAYKARKTSNAEYMQDLYQAVFARAATQWEAKMILTYLDGGGLRDVALTTLLGSTEYKKLALQRRPAPPLFEPEPEAQPQSRRPSPQAPAKSPQALYQECVDAYNHLIRLMAAKPQDKDGLAKLQSAHDDYMQARKRYEEALKKE